MGLGFVRLLESVASNVDVRSLAWERGATGAAAGCNASWDLSLCWASCCCAKRRFSSSESETCRHRVNVKETLVVQFVIYVRLTYTYSNYDVITQNIKQSLETPVLNHDDDEY